MNKYRLIYTLALTVLLAVNEVKAQDPEPATPSGLRVHGSVYGGGNQADVKTNTEVNICAKDNGSGTYVAVSEGDGVTIKGNVYGGGKGIEDEFTCAKAMVGVDGEGLTDNNGGTTVRIGNGTVGTLEGTGESQTLKAGTGNVYGGGEVGRVEKNTVVTIGFEPTGEGVTSEPDIKGNVFGAGAGKETHGYSALVRGNSTVTVQYNAVVGGSVYGGGEIATVGRYIVINGYPTEPNGGGICTVEIKDNATIKGNVVGAGKGVTPSYSSESKHAIPGTALVPFADKDAYLLFLETLALASETQVTIGGTTTGKTATVIGNVYGGSESGFLQRHSQVTVLDNCTVGTSSANGNVYGGGKGLEDFADAGRVSGYTSVTISGGTTHGSVYGGGELGYTKGGAKVNMTGSTAMVEGDVYGGGALADTNIGNGNGYVAVPGLATGASVTGLYEIKYKATTDGTALDGKIYYELKDGLYVVKPGLTAGDSVSGLYEIEYKASTETTAALGKTYYEVYVDKDNVSHPGVYVVKNGLKAGDAISNLYEITYQTTENTTALANKSYYTLTHPTTVNLLGGTIKGDAYGGGLGDKGRTEPATYYTAEEAAEYNNNNSLNPGDEGYVSEGDVKTAAVSGIDAVEATVYGDINVNLGSANGSTTTAFYLTNYPDPHSSVAKSGRVFGCNNLNGSPQGDVTVAVYKTKTGKNASGDNVTRTDASAKGKKVGETGYVAPTYELAAVYGGGNLAGYAPSASGKKASVIIETCDVSVHSVYGGGNAAAVPETDVLVKGAYEIAEVFGGGNGKDQYTLDGTNWNSNPGANVNGNATTLLKGGYIHEAYGGSNSKGTISGDVSINKSSGGYDDDVCPLQVDDLYGAGKDADIEGDLIMIMGCSTTRTENIYGCSKNANVKGNVELTITSGEFGKVFGGNNESGSIFGHIIVNIEEVGCTPIIIDELYGCGNDAAYSVYGYFHAKQYVKTVSGEEDQLFLDAGMTIPLYKDGDNYYKDAAKTIPLYKDNNGFLYTDQEKTRALYMPRQSVIDTNPIVTFADKPHTIPDATTHQYDDPQVNIISCTHIGQVFGGGLGTGAIMYGNPKVNINMIAGEHASGVPDKMIALGIDATEAPNPNNLGIIGTVYGGGNAADVIGDPTVNIGTVSTVQYHASVDASGNYTMGASQDVVGAYITGNVYGGGKGEVDNFFCDKAMIGKDGAGIIDADGDGKVDKDGGTTVNIYNGFVRGNVYGGGQIGRVEKNTEVTIGTGDGVAPGGTATSAPIIMGSVYGGGAGEEEHGYAALVRGNPTVTIQGNAKVRHSVYGGGEIASVARYNVPKTEKDVEDAIAAGYTEAVLGMPYALKDPNSGTCTVTVRGYAEIGPEEAMQMTKAGGPDDTGYVFGAGKGILPGGTYAFAQGTTRRMVLYDADVHTNVGQTGSKWQWVDPDHSDTNKNVWEYFEDLDEYIKFIQTLALSSRTDVTITGNAFVKGSVYGGSENGIVQFNTDVKIQSGQIGCGEGETSAHPDTYWTSNSEDPTKFAECAHWLFQEPYAPYDPYATHKNDADGKYYYDSGHTQEAAGGAMVATDGHTYYGNVFGGGSGSIPYFDTTLGQSVYLHSAGQVKGNTNVTISGGHILTNVYGGCEATNVDGTATVTMTDGTVGVPRTDEQIIAHPLTGYIFGGGKGDQRIFFNKDTNVKDAVVTVEGGRVYGSVYGGGEDGHVLRNVTLTIGKQTTTGEGDEAVTTTSGPKIGTKGTSYYDGHVFGGGRGFGGDALTAGNVGGSVDLNILDGEILGSVYGGGRLASVGYGLYLVDDEVNGVKPYGIMRPDDEYDGSYTNPSTEEAEDFFTKGRGHINITISGGTIGNDDEYAYDADNLLTHTKGGNVFAGGMGRMYKLDDSTPISSLDWWKLGNVKSTKLTISGDAKIKSCVYGGGELGMVQGGNHTSADSKTVSTEIIINGGTIGTEIKSDNVTQYTFGSVFGGGYGSLTEKLDHTGSTNPTYSTYKYTYPKYIAGRVKGSTEVTMTGGVVLASVYGGGEMAAVGESKVLSESTDPKVLGETLTGNNGVPIEANTYVTISDGTIGKKPITLSDNSTRYFGGAKMGNVYGGGSGDNNTVRSGHVYGNTYVTISDGTIYHNVYGGGAYGTVGDFDYNVTNEEVTVNNQTVTVKKVSGIKELKTSGTGVATVTITNGTIGYDGKENGMVFGSSRGDINRPEERDDYTAWVYDANVTIGTAGTPASGTEGQEGYVPATDASGPDIKGSIYGSGENGHTFNNTIVTVNGGKIGIDDSSDPGYTVSSNDKDYSGAEYTFRGNVYGGGCGTDKYYSNHALENHSGNGQLFNALAGVVYGNAEVNINGGTVVRNVYGAGAMGSVGRKVSTTENNVTTTTITGGTTTINITGGTIGVDGTVGDGNVFGAARGDADATSNEFALVRKETSVSVTGGTVNGNVYGGGELGCVGVYEISSDYRTFTWQDTDGVTNTADNDKNTGICKVTVDGSSAVINGNVFGAGKGKDDTFWCEKGIAYSTNVSIKNGTVNGKVYGGGEVGRVETDTEVKVGDGEGTAGGASAPTIAGSVFGGGAGVETHGYSALVRGNTKVTVEGNASVGHSVFGGGEIASVGRYALDSNKMPSILQGGGYCYVTIRGHATITDDVFGAGEGVTPHFDNDNADETKRSRRMTLKNGWESLVGGNRFDWDYLQDKSDYLTYLETLALATHPEVTIGGSAAVGGSVFGGGELGLTKGSVIVNIQGGTIAEDVYGGGSLANTNTTSSVDTNGDGVADKTVHPTTSVNLKSGTVNHNVYGGGLGRLEKAAVLYTATDPEVTGGTKNEGDVKTPAVTPVEAKVYGTVLVKLNEPVTTTTGEGESTTTTTTYGDCEVKGTIFGCNNLNGSPQKDVTVHVWKTVQKDNSGAVTDKPTKNTNTYEMTAVYGGGNLAAFYPDDETARASAKANVIIDGCDLTSIGSVYGGGNAASVPATEVIVNGTYEIGEVFGGGNGKGNVSYDDGITYVTNPGANVGYLLYPTELDPPKGSIEARNPYAYGSGKAHALINGGTVHTVYGGSNTKGNVRVESRTTLEDGDCDNNVGKAYGGGNDAPMDGNAILEVGCLAGMSKAFGGAANANVEGDVVLNIINGTYGQVFGGNDQGGVISGTITVNIEETGCRPIIIGQLYGGGNFAPYSVENIDKSRTDIDFTDPTAENYYKNFPKVNVKSFTSIGTIFGGGYGEEAVLEGNPTVNINVYKGKYVNDDRTVIDSGAKVVGKIWKKPGDQGYDSDGYSIPEHKKGMIGAINDVFGGGNEAKVIGTPHVNIGTKMGEVIKLASMAIEDSEGKAPSEVGWIPSYELVTVEGVDIRGNVYGGGNAADVTGDAEVVIGKKNSIKTYKFTSYSAESGGTVWSSGLAQTTGVTKGNLEEVEILTNGKYGEFVGRKYYVSPNAATDGSARTELKDANGASLNPQLYVAIKPFENKKIYNFESYSAETGGTQYSTGTASATGNFKDFNGTDYMQIVVLTNGEISWEGKTFYVPANAQPGSTRYQLHKADGSTVDVWVSITE